MGNDEKFIEGNIPKKEYDSEHIFLRACSKGKPKIENNVINVSGRTYIVQK